MAEEENNQNQVVEDDVKKDDQIENETESENITIKDILNRIDSVDENLKNIMDAIKESRDSSDQPKPEEDEQPETDDQGDSNEEDNKKDEIEKIADDLDL